VVGPGARGRLTRTGDRIAWYVSSVGFERWARLIAIAVIPLLPPDDGLAAIAPLFAALAVYVLATLVARRGPVLRTLDLVVAAGVIALAGAAVLPFLPFLLVSVAGPGSRRGPWAGLAAGGALGAVLLGRLALTGVSPVLGLGGSLSIALLLPLAGLTAAAAVRVLDDRAVRDRLVLQQANRLLSALQAIADDIPGGLDVATVSAALLAELRTIPGVDQAVVYAESHGQLHPSASAGLTRDHLLTLRLAQLDELEGSGGRLLDRSELPKALRMTQADSPHWLVFPLPRGDRLVGVIVAGFGSVEAARVGRPMLGSIVEDAALALDNARLFDGTRERAADTARRQVAGDLHDGVAQSLAHLRMELELLARTPEPGVSAEASRLARVAGSALEDLRGTISLLRRPRQGDLASLLGEHLDALRTPHGPEVALRCSGHVALDPARTEQALRVAQEAVSNALRHADAARITVTLEQAGDHVRLVVEDDGDGLASGPARQPATNGGQPPPFGNGVGLPSMRSRADALAGQLTLASPPGGGTVVALEFPVRAPTGVPADISPATR
jgi:signal transduction histidine kinase